MGSAGTKGKGSAARSILPRRIAAAAAWVAKRLRNRPDTEHDLTINRLVLSGLTLIYLIVASSFGNKSAAGMLDAAGLLLVFHWTCSFALFGHVVLRPGVSVARRAVGMLFDFTIFSYCMHIGGEAMAPLYPIYLWMIFGNGFRFGLTYLAAASALGVISFALVVLTTEFWHSHLPLSAGLTSGLILLPIYVSSLIRKLSDAKRQAEEASKAKSLFLASVSHELRTPLNAIIGLSDLMRDTHLDADQKDMTQTIGQSGRTLLKLINTILDLSRIEAGRMPSQVEPFDLFALLGSVRRLLQVQAQAKGLRLALHVTARTPSQLIGDKGHLEEILINLASNAVKFTAKGHVVIAVDAVPRTGSGVRLRVEITDTGIGIAEESQKRIFESFTQANEKIIDQFGGTGLGLSIVKQLVELHGGEIGVISAPEKGATFWFEIDIDAQENARNAAPAFAEPTVLLSADPAIREALAGLPGLRTAETADVAAGLLEAVRAEGIRQPVAIVDLPADANAATALARRLGGSQSQGALLIAIAAPDETGMLPEPARSLFVSALPRPVDGGAIGRALAVVGGCLRGADHSNVAVFAPVAPHTRLSILVAEDNRTNQKVIGKILDRVGHDVTIVENGEAALEALDEHVFDLVLMDVNMPVMNGIEATKLYRFGALGQKHVPIVALTADATPEVAERCSRAGMDGCLTKPIEPARLVETIDRLVLSKREAPLVDDAAIDADAPPAAADPSGPAIEPHKLEELKRLGGAEFVDDLVQQFLDDSIVVLHELADAVRAGDVEGFREQAHALRSGAANVGARRIYEMCLAWRQIDAFALQTSGEHYVGDLETEFERVRDAVQSKAAA